MPPITLYFLQASRSIRTAWLLEELGLDYEVKFSERVNQKAPEAFKLVSGNPLGKFPTLQDGKLTIIESGAINEYIISSMKVLSTY
jgi:glutathione S-transferase